MREIVLKKLHTVVLALCITFLMSAQEVKEGMVEFDRTVCDFGDVLLSDGPLKCSFNVRNISGKPLVIYNVSTSCGCTDAKWTKEPIQPGQKGVIKVTYNGTGRFPGHFKKSITVRTNGTVEMTRLYIEGDMTEAK